MKLKCLAITITVSLLSLSNGTLAQNMTPKLNQLKLMEDLWVGSWQSIIGIDSLEVTELIQFGKVFEYNVYYVFSGKKSFGYGGSYVFSSKEDKFKGFAFTPDGNYQTWIGAFTAEKKLSMDIVKNFIPEDIIIKEVIEWENPLTYTVTFFNINGTKVGGSKWTRSNK